MLPEAVLKNIFEVVNWHRTWIKALDYGTLEEFVVADRSGLSRTVCPTFRLEVRIPNEGFYKGQVISIPYFEIEAAIERHCADKSFSHRLEKCELNYQDVNLLFQTASWCDLQLELE